MPETGYFIRIRGLFGVMVLEVQGLVALFIDGFLTDRHILTCTVMPFIYLFIYFAGGRYRI
jgi:hypothetical protein